MKTRYAVVLSMLAGAALGAVSVGGLYAQGKAPGAYVVIDISGYYVDPSTTNGLVYYPMTPCRVVDTRT